MKEFILDDQMILVVSGDEWKLKNGASGEEVPTSPELIKLLFPQAYQDAIGSVSTETEAPVDKRPRARSGNKEVDVMVDGEILRIGFYYYADKVYESKVAGLAKGLFEKAVTKAIENGGRSYLRLDEGQNIRDLDVEELHQLIDDIQKWESEIGESQYFINLQVTGAAVVARSPSVSIPEEESQGTVEITLEPTANLTGGTIVDKSQMDYQWSYGRKLIGVLAREMGPTSNVSPMPRGLVIIHQPTFYRQKSSFALGRHSYLKKVESLGFLVNGGNEVLVVTLTNGQLPKGPTRPATSAYAVANRVIELIQCLDNLYPNGYLKDDDRGFVTGE